MRVKDRVIGDSGEPGSMDLSDVFGAASLEKSCSIGYGSARSSKRSRFWVSGVAHFRSLADSDIHYAS